MVINTLKDALFYVFLSKYGRKLVRASQKTLKNLRSSNSQPDLINRMERALKRNKDMLYMCFKASDEGFKDFIPPWYLTQSKFTPEQSYFRFVKISTILLGEHSSFFNAFNILLDKQAKKRYVLLAFLKRTYDDLLDEANARPKDLFGGEPSEKLLPNLEYALLLHLRQTIRRVAPYEQFPNYYNTLERTHNAQSRTPEKDNVKEVIFEKARLSFLIDTYIMVNELSDKFIHARCLTAELFNCLDDFYDYEVDLSKGIWTYINQCSNPENALREKYKEAATYLRCVAPNPEPYLEGIFEAMEGLIIARKQGLRKLSDVIYGNYNIE